MTSTSSAIVRDPSWLFESLGADESGKCRVNVPDSLIFRRVRAPMGSLAIATNSEGDLLVGRTANLCATPFVQRQLPRRQHAEPEVVS
jgi:hypothetical protein